MSNYRRVVKLDLPEPLCQKIRDNIQHSNIKQSAFYRSQNSSHNIVSRLIMRWFFKEGYFQVYRLDETLEKEILEFYKPFTDSVGHAPKIRLKITHDVRQLMPHSDAADGGDRSSIVTVIAGNGETTSWYNRGDDCHSSWWDLLTMRKVDSISFDTDCAYLFNNAQVHGVTKCKPNSTRYLLAVSWQNVDYTKLSKAYDHYSN